MVRLTPWVGLFLLLWATNEDFLASHLVMVLTPFRYLGLGLWFFFAWLTLMGVCSAIALFVRRGMIWMSVIVTCILVFMGFVLCGLMFLALEAVWGSWMIEWYFALVCPILDEDFHRGPLAPTLGLGASLGVWACVAIAIHAGIGLLAYRGPASMRAVLRDV